MINIANISDVEEIQSLVNLAYRGDEGWTRENKMYCITYFLWHICITIHKFQAGTHAECLSMYSQTKCEQ